MKSRNRNDKRIVAGQQQSHDRAEPVRLDQWLWSSRFYKTRRMASDAVKGGHIWLNGKRTKPAKTVMPDDLLRIRKFPQEYVVIVLALSNKRLSAPLAKELYEETPESKQLREEKQLLDKQMRMSVKHPRGKPDARDRRSLLKIKQQTPTLD